VRLRVLARPDNSVTGPPSTEAKGRAPLRLCEGRALILCLIVAFFLLGQARPVSADSSLRFEVALSREGSAALAQVVENGRAILALSAAAPEDAYEKAFLVVDRLASLAAAGKTSDSFALVSRAGGPAIVCDSEVVLAYESADEQAQSAELVMARWLENIKRAFSRPYVSVLSGLVSVKIGQQVALPVSGPGLPYLRVEITPSYVAEAWVDSQTGRVTIQGKSVGQARLDLKAKDEVVSVAVGVVFPGVPAAGGAYTPAQTSAPAKQPPLVTWFSNRPENVAGPGPLFHAQFPPNASGRLFYHHKSVADQPLRFAVWVANRDAELPQELFLIRGTGGPDSEAPIAGRDAIASFYSNWAALEGESLTLQPGEFRCLHFVDWPPSTTVGGLLQFTCLEGPAVDVYVEAVNSAHQPASPLAASLSSPLSKQWLFPGDREIPFHYVAEETPAHFLLGLPGERALTSQEILRGSYGIQQRLEILIANPFPTPRYVELRCLAGGGGLAYFVGLLDGRLVSVELSRSGQSASLATFAIPPNTTVPTSLITTSVGGCWYPVVLTLQTKSADRGS